MFNQQIHGSKRSLRSVEDFTQFEQRTAYFNGDHVSAQRKGVNLPDRFDQVPMMAQMQNIIDFLPTPKLDPLGRLDPTKATAQELTGEQVFMGKGRCGECHTPQTSFLDNNMHDLKLERFYNIGQTVNGLVSLPDGPIKTFTLRGIKDSPPYLHDGRLLTLADTVEFLNLVLGLKLTQEEKESLVAYMLTLGMVRRTSTELQPERRKENEMMRLLSSMGVVIMASIAPASGQSPPAPGNPAGMPPGTIQSTPGSPAPRQTNQSDRVFIHAAAVGGLAEVDLGKLAMQKAAGRAVKDFAALMVRDHGAANDKLAAIAKEDGVTLPDHLDEEHRTMRTKLKQSSGPRFDHAYIQGQIIDHQKTAQTLEYEIGSGENNVLKAFASDTLPAILEHLRMAQAIAVALGQQTEGLSRD